MELLKITLDLDYDTSSYKHVPAVTVEQPSIVSEADLRAIFKTLFDKVIEPVNFFASEYQDDRLHFSRCLRMR